MDSLIQRRFIRKRKACHAKQKRTSSIHLYSSSVPEDPRDCGMCGDCHECDRIAYGRELSTSLMRLREEGELCDGSLCTEDGFEMKIHSFMICAVSPVLQTIFRNGGVWKVTLPDISAEVLKILVDFIYTGTANLSEDNVEDVLCFAQKYGLEELVWLCQTFMTKHLSISNCIRYLYIAEAYDMLSLEEEARRFALWNWTDVWQNNRDFEALLTADDLCSLLEDDRLNVTNEDEIHNVIVKWIDYDVVSRCDEWPYLLSKIRYNVVNNIPLVSDLLDREQRQIYIKQIPDNRFRSRTPRRLIFTIGGWCNGHATHDIEVYDCKAGIWILSPHVDIMPRAYHGISILHGQIYVIGGYNGQECYRSVRSFDPVIAAWTECNSMNEPRCYISTATLNGYIYAIGGFDGEQRKDSCERYDQKTNQWSMIAPMKFVRSDASAAAHQGKIFVCGGYDGSDILDSMEMYNPDDNEWTLVQNLPNPRSGHKLLEFNNSLYLIGGFNGTNRLDTVYHFSHTFDEWIEDLPLISPRSNFAAVEFEDKLYVIGGFNGHTIIPAVESYDPNERLWMRVSYLNTGRSALTACVVQDIPNAICYSANGPYGKMTAPEYGTYLSIT